MKLLNNETDFWISPTYFSFNGNPMGSAGARFGPCGDVFNTYTAQCVDPFRGGNGNWQMSQQSNNKLIVRNFANISRCNFDGSNDPSFNVIYLPGSGVPNLDLFGGLYVNNDDEIYVIGSFNDAGDSIFECSGSSYNFNTNIYKIKPDGGIDTSYSGITIDTFPFVTNGEPRLMTSENDPSGKVLVIRFSAFTGNTTWAPIMRLNPDGRPDPTFNNSAFSGVPYTSILFTYAQPDGKYIVAGDNGAGFQNIGGYANQRTIVRLNNDGSVDTSFVYTGGSINITFEDLEQDKYGNYHGCWTVGGPGYGYYKLSNTGQVIGTKTFTSVPLAILVQEDTFYVGGFQSMTDVAVPGYATLLKYDLDGEQMMCPFPSPTPTRTPTPTITPTITLTNTPTQTPGLPPSPTITSTPTRTPQITPTNTPSPSSTSTISCAEYYVVPDFGQTMEWYDCEGNFQSQVVSGGTPYYIPCAQIGTVAVAGVINQGAAC